MPRRKVRRIVRKLSPAQQKKLKRQRELIAEELPELVARDQMRNEARQEATLSGEVRRAVHSSDWPLSAIAARAGIPPLLLDDFLTGERTLRSDVMDRLAEVLGFQLAHKG